MKRIVRQEDDHPWPPVEHVAGGISGSGPPPKALYRMRLWRELNPAFRMAGRNWKYDASMPDFEEIEFDIGREGHPDGRHVRLTSMPDKSGNALEITADITDIPRALDGAEISYDDYAGLGARARTAAMYRDMRAAVFRGVPALRRIRESYYGEGSEATAGQKALAFADE